MNNMKRINNYGDIRWYKYGTEILHRLDGPAVECANGYKSWYKEGKLHRENGPAAEYTNGNKCWFKEGLYHREDGPAVEYHNGTVEFWLHGVQCNSLDELVIKNILE